MAERRMFAKTIVDSDAFLDMPLSAQALYFHLGMRADDDGFINSPKGIMRQCGAKEDDLKILFAKKFILPFESGVVTIKHWKINNYIPKDRYTETKYKVEKSTLFLDENNAYTFNEGAPLDTKPERRPLTAAQQKRLDAKKDSDLPYSFEYKIRNAFVGEQCPICGRTMSYESNLSKPTIQHNVPISLGGKHEIDNISVICNQCNSSIQNRQVTEPYNTEMVRAVWERIGNESGMYTQDRIGKERIGKDNNSIYLSAPDEDDEDEFSTGFSTEFSTQDDRERLKTKIRHGELFQGKVILSDAQMDDLLDKLSYDEFNHYVGVVVNRIDIGKPFKRKTHYQAILDMAMQDRKLR